MLVPVFFSPTSSRLSSIFVPNTTGALNSAWYHPFPSYRIKVGRLRMVTIIATMGRPAMLLTSASEDAWLELLSDSLMSSEPCKHMPLRNANITDVVAQCNRVPTSPSTDCTQGPHWPHWCDRPPRSLRLVGALKCHSVMYCATFGKLIPFFSRHPPSLTPLLLVTLSCHPPLCCSRVPTFCPACKCSHVSSTIIATMFRVRRGLPFSPLYMPLLPLPRTLND